jgi:spore germination protein YaaH/flagellar hook assembly protein FlgD
VFGFLPYWEVSGASTSLNYATLTTIAYFSVGADAAGNLRKRNSDGSLTTGWGGWTSAAMTNVINTAHSHGTRVVLTASVFAWTSTGAAAQRALLGSATARANFARQLTAAVRDRGADGVNLDFEPLVSGQEANFVALLKTLRADLNAIQKGYQITYDTTGFIGNYPLEASVGAAAADAVFIMGYDYRTDGASTSGSVDPLSGPTYDLADTVRQYTARISPSRVILGLPWYGRAWSTASSAPRSTNVSGAKYGYSTAVNYENIPALIAKYGRKWDATEQSPYIAYQRQNCTSTYGCVTSWRQVWFDDAASLALRYQLVTDYGLRGAGLWALGYQGADQTMVKALADAFVVDHSAPEAGIRILPAKATDEGIVVAWSAADVSAVASFDVQVASDGGAWTPWLTATTKTTDVWLGADGHVYAFRVRATDVKGNAGAWNVTSVAGKAPSSLAVGGFGRVTLDGLAYRTGPTTSAAKLGSLPAGTVVALTAGPVSADGATWYEVTQPIREWTPVSFVERGVWVAVKTSTATNVAPFHAPNATLVDAGIAGLDFGSGGLTGTTPNAVAGRTFSPNGDGARDTLRIRWTATLAFDSLTLNVLRPDGSLVGALAVPTRTTGTHTFAWDGTVAGKRVADGGYVLQLAGAVGSKLYRAPSALPATPAQIARFGVVVDTVAPVIASASASASVISPNHDGRSDSAAFSLSATGAATWSFTADLGTAAPVRTLSGTGGSMAATWNGTSDTGATVPDGSYTVALAACDVAGNCARRAYPVRVDTAPPVVTSSASQGSFSPNGDGAGDSASLAWTASEPSGGSVSVWRGTTLVRRWTVSTATAGAITWDGRTATGAAAADGRYTVKVDLRDAAGNRGVATSTVTVDRTAGWLRWSGSFFPQDGDALAPTASISWSQTRSAAVTLAVYNASGELVRTVWTSRSLAAGTHRWTWNGRQADGTYAPQGQYTARLTVVSTLGTQALRRSVWAAAFPLALSAASIRPGQTLTVRFRSVEALKTMPRATLRQPGLAAVTVPATKLADGTFLATFVVKTGAAGPASVTIVASDSGGRANTTVAALAVAL